MKSTQPTDHSTTPVTFEHARLRQLSNKLKSLHPEDSEILELAEQLFQIGDGSDANIVLGVKRSQGQNPNKEDAHYVTQMAIRWIAGRLNPLDGEEPPPSKVAVIEEAATAFDLDVENLARACPSLKELKSIATFEWDSQRPRLTKCKD
jgi:hypothetical protein